MHSTRLHHKRVGVIWHTQGTENRQSLVAQDILQHFDHRLIAMDGKGMIVCMSRRICAELIICAWLMMTGLRGPQLRH